MAWFIFILYCVANKLSCADCLSFFSTSQVPGSSTPLFQAFQVGQPQGSVLLVSLSWHLLANLEGEELTHGEFQVRTQVPDPFMTMRSYMRHKTFVLGFLFL